MWHIFEADSADALWGQIVERLRAGQNVLRQPSRSGDTRELLHAALTLRDPRRRWVHSRRPAMNPAFAIAEIIWIVSGRRDARFLSYFNNALHRFAGPANEFHGAYGHRLRHQFGFDQLEAAYVALKANPDSRQVVLQLWDPRSDMPDASGRGRDPDIPCNTQSLLKVRGDTLEWVQVMRSNDVFLGLPHNLVQFTALQEIMAGWLGLRAGEYQHISDSLHIYERDLTVVNSAPFSPAIPGDSLSLPKDESEATFEAMVSIVERIIDESADSSTLAKLADQVVLPGVYQDMVRILIAEGLRRRKASGQANEMAQECTSLALRCLWNGWVERISNK